MRKNNLKGILLILVISLLFYLTAANHKLRPAPAMAGIFDKGTPDHLIGKFTTIVDEQGNTLSMMARVTSVGDELYTAEGRTYRVERVQGDRAEARFLGTDPQILAYNDFFSRQEVPVMKNLAEQKKGVIGIYHSHTDESYVPSDGTYTIPFKGGIYQVGKTMVDRLQGKAVQVDYNQTAHDPHDNNAYVRSRRTAAQLMKDNPVALFDIHRDGVPDPSYYRADIEGQDLAKLRLVIGRENPRMSANMDFAKRMMAAANNIHPTVVKEIFVGAGDYNQDLLPTALLIEAGTHTNSKEEAEQGISLFTDAVPTVLGITPGPAAPPVPGAGGKPSGTAGGAWKALGWILGLTVIGGVGFLLINSGSWGDTKKRLSSFGKEFTSFLGTHRAVRKPGKKDAHLENGKPLKDYDPPVDGRLQDEKDKP